MNQPPFIKGDLALTSDQWLRSPLHLRLITGLDFFGPYRISRLAHLLIVCTIDKYDAQLPRRDFYYVFCDHRQGK